MKLLALLPHFHRWLGTRYNSRFEANEQRCWICGKRRHHLYEDRFGPTAKPGKWRKGNHPGRRP